MADWNTIRDYIYENKSLVLATVDSEGNPQIRHIGGYTIEDKDILFQTAADSNKVKEIEKWSLPHSLPSVSSCQPHDRPCSFVPPGNRYSWNCSAKSAPPCVGL